MRKKTNNLQGLLIPALIALPMLVATIMYHTGWGVPLGKTNKGELLQPPQKTTELQLSHQDQDLTSVYTGDKKRWRILVPVSKNCDEACQHNLYLTRQVHIRLAEKAYRVERILLLLDELAQDELQNLKQEHPETRILNSKPEYVFNWLADTQVPQEKTADNYYLIDQEGYAMMAYNIKHTGQDLLDDLKRVLKYTYDK